MNRLRKALDKVEEVLTWVPLALAALIGSLQIILRFAFNIHLLWGEEAVIYLVIFSTYIGSALLVRDNGHIAMQVIGPFLKGRGKWVMDLIGTAIATSFFILAAYLSLLLVSDPSVANTVTRVLKIPLWAIDASVLLGFSLMAVRSAQNFVALIVTRSPLRKATETEEAMALAERDPEGENPNGR